MNKLARTLTIVVGLGVMIVALFAGTASAQASPLAPSENSSAVTMRICNNMKRPIEVTVFPDSGQVVRNTIDTSGSWALPASYGRMNEISFRFPGDPNYQFLGHFEYANGKFRMIDVVHSNVAYYVQASGPSARIWFMPRMTAEVS